MPTVAQSVLAPAGPQAVQIAHLWWLIFWVSTAVFLIVMGLIAVAIRRGDAPPAAESSLKNVVGAGVGATVVILFVWIVANALVTHANAAPQMSDAVSINVVGHQWWWEIEYSDPNAPSLRFHTANEIHIPVGRPIVLSVTSRDVIHTFWVPNLQGKRDLIPGYTTSIALQADKPGIYRGQCAEFCGYQHANMAFYVTAEDDATFKGWLSTMRQPAAEPSTEEQRSGRDVFMRSSCSACHTIRGTNAGGQVGPELTHFGSRGFVAAGTLENTSEHLAKWIANSQQIKPGNKMPPNNISADELHAVAAYLEALK